MPKLNALLTKWLGEPTPPSAQQAALDCLSCTRFPGKCCAFQPFVPNFILGAPGVEWPAPNPDNFLLTALGLIPTSAYRERHAKSPPSVQGPDLFCAFYESGRCQIWSWRPAECSTYFCEPEPRLPQDLELSQRGFDAEVACAQMALIELGFSVDDVRREIDFLNGSAVPSAHAAPRRQIYEACFRVVSGFTPEQVRAWMEEL